MKRIVLLKIICLIAIIIGIAFIYIGLTYDFRVFGMGVEFIIMGGILVAFGVKNLFTKQK